MAHEPDHAEGAGEQMDSELEAITQRLQTLKRKLDARRALVTTEPGEVSAEIASGDPVEMNPLTAGRATPPPPRD